MTEQATFANAPGQTESRVRVQRWFSVSAGVSVILLSFAGFGPALIDQSRRYAPPTALVMAHGATCAAWLVLFLGQATLAATGRMDLHRRLGWIGPALAAAIVILGVFTSIEVTHRDSDLSGDLTRLLARPGAPPPTEEENIRGIWGPLAGLIQFSLLVAAGLLLRHRPEIHKRIMVFALFPLAAESLLHLCGALVGRAPASPSVIGAAGLVVGALLLTVVSVYEKIARGRVHPASMLIPVLLVVWWTLFNAVFVSSSLGLKVAAWLVG